MDAPPTASVFAPDAWQGRRALVTGGASGIGLAIAQGLGAFACQVVIATRDENELAPFHDAPFKGLETTLAFDVADDRATRKALETAGDFDIVIHAAGTILRGGQEFEPASFERVVNVNLSGAMRVAMACRDGLAASSMPGGGCAIFIASMLSYFGSGFVPAYSASKGGIVQLTKSLAIAWAPRKIRVNALAPGWIATPLTKPLRDVAERSEAIVGRTPLGRWGEPDDVVGAALFLASPAAGFITGAILNVDGGYSIA